MEKNDGGGGREPEEYEEVYHTHTQMTYTTLKQQAGKKYSFRAELERDV